MNTRWTLVITHQAPGARIISLKVPRIAWVLLVAVAVAGCCGLGRLGKVYGQYLFARFSLVQLHRENTVLRRKVDFLGRLAHGERTQLEQLSEFENLARLKHGLLSIDGEALQAGVGGRPSAAELVASLLDGPAVRSADSIRHDVGALLRRARLQDSTLAELSEQISRVNSRWAQRPSTWPVWGGRITSPFGARIHPFTGYSIRHQGLDIAHVEWTPIYCTANGIVRYVGRKQYYGNLVVIDHHGNGFETRYAHLVQAEAEEGQVVRRGDLVGYMGRTGRSTGVHLHYEVRKNGRPVNPLDYILPRDVIVD